MANQITYADKVNNQVSGLPDINKVRDVDMNELKNTININALETDQNTSDLAALVEISGYVPLSYVYSSVVVPTGIVAGEFRLSNHIPSSATHLYFHKEDNSLDVSEIIESTQVGSYVYFQSRKGAKISGLYLVTAVSDQTTYMDYTVTVVSAYGTDISLSDGLYIAVGLMPKIVNPGINGQFQVWDSTQPNGERAANFEMSFVIPIGQADTDISLGTDDGASFNMPFNFTMTSVEANVTVAPTGSTQVTDIHINGVTALSTLISIDVSELSSRSAATPPVISTASMSEGDVISFPVVQIGSTDAGQNLNITIKGYTRDI